MIVYMNNVLNPVLRKCKRVKYLSGFLYMLKVCDACTDNHRVYVASRQYHMKQYRRAYYIKKQELLGMRVRQYRLCNDDKMACPLRHSIVSKVNISSQKKPASASNFRMVIPQTTIEIPYRLSGSSTVWVLSRGGADDADDVDDADDTDDSDAKAFSAVYAAAGNGGDVWIKLAKVGVDNIHFWCYRQSNGLRMQIIWDTNPRVRLIRMGSRIPIWWDSYPIALGNAYGIRIPIHWDSYPISLGNA